MPEQLWAESLNTVVYTTNRILSSKNQSETRYELFKGEKPDIRNLKIFGKKAIIRESDNARDGKFAPRGEDAIFVGYTDRFNTYRFYISEPVKQIIFSCDAKFIAQPEVGPELINQQSTTGSQALITDDDETELEDNSNGSTGTNSSSSSSYMTPPGGACGSDDSNDSDDSDETIIDQPTNRDQRAIDQIQHDHNYAGPALVGVHEAVMFTLDDEPRTLKDAQESDDWDNWKKDMDDEIRALEKNKTWVLVDEPSHARPIKNKWVFRAKLIPDGSIDRYKARLVAKGFTQIENIDYKETSAHVASMTTIRMFLAIASQNSMHLIQFDVKTAFLYGDLEEELYMEQPDNYQKDSNKVCKPLGVCYLVRGAHCRVRLRQRIDTPLLSGVARGGVLSGSPSELPASDRMGVRVRYSLNSYKRTL